MIRRNILLVLAGLLVASCLPPHREAWSQTPEAMRVIGILFPGKPPEATTPGIPPVDLFRIFLDALAKRGYVQGKNLAAQFRMGEYEQLPALAKELERLKVEAIWVIGTRGTRIVQEAVKRTPLVVYSCDPFEHVTKLSRPGSNVTGTTCMTTELSPKRLELLKELLPGARRVVFFGDPADAPEGWRLTREAAAKLGVAIQLVSYKDREGIPAALQQVARIKPDAVFVYPDVMQDPGRLAEFWVKHALPSVNAFPFYAEAGGLMAYGAVTAEISAMMGGQVASILDGVRPGDIPFQRATQFHLVINRKTAKALGIAAPQSMLLRADRVIE